MAVYKRGKNWVADFYLGGRQGRRMRRTAPTRKLAEAIERDSKVKELKGELEVDQTEDICLSDFIEKYLELFSPTKTENTRKLDGYYLDHIRTFFGDPLLKNVKREQVEAYKAHRRLFVSARSVNRELDLLKSLFNRAVEWNYLKRSPADGVKKFKIDEKEPRFLTSEQGCFLMDSATGQMKNFIVTALNTGLRKGELFSLKWSDLDFKRQELRVRKAKGKRYRVIPMNEFLAETLRRHPRHIKSDFVFHNSDGSQWKDIRTSFNSTVERAGLLPVRIHDLRHSFVSNLVMAGEDLRTVQELAGHRSITTTMKYAHLAPGHLKGSVERLNWTRKTKETGEAAS